MASHEHRRPCKEEADVKTEADRDLKMRTGGFKDGQARDRVTLEPSEGMSPLGTLILARENPFQPFDFQKYEAVPLWCF